MYSVCLLVVGTEIAEGNIQDGHTQYLATTLRRLGLRIVESTIVPDDAEIMSRALRHQVSLGTIVIVTGGLGPTSDDITREVIARVTERELEFQPEIWEQLRSRFREWHDVEPAQSNKRQAYIPKGYEIIPNAVGTAPGFTGVYRGCRVVALPGPPRELHHTVEEVLVPRLEQDFGISQEEELRASAFLVGESALEDALQRAVLNPSVRWGTRVGEYGIEFYLRGGTEHDRRKGFDALRRELGEFRIREGSTGAAQRLLTSLSERGHSVVTAESCTGGLLSTLLTEIPGSSRGVWGGYVVYANEAKERLLDVPSDVIEQHGAVSGETIGAMIDGALSSSGAHVAIAVSGIAGPSGGTPEKPVGTVWVGVGLSDDRRLIRRFNLVGGRDRVRRKSAVLGLLVAADLVGGTEVDLDTYEIC